ncbi:MAG: Alpha-N-acetylglucosaminidase (NAGLU) tim-barrel domain protein [Lentisphaerae bacterium ADurb.Bin242]|nr:MAG: Alpha-N-acetylglucosaminidase (NAGLU) tim-barrel domain protein [Lentisphaerae bacterium ADurb.Bin242]
MLKLLIPENSGIFQIAADAFAELWRKITGEFPERTQYLSPEDSRVIVFGSDAVNPFVHEKIMEGLFDGFRIRCGSDDYHLLSLERDGREYLFLAGGRPRALLYAVYRFFEVRAGVRYFWDGDRIPMRNHLGIGGLNLAESPRFQYRAIRYFAHRGLKRFQAEHWDFDDWRKEIDWLLKKRLNLFMLRIGQDDLFQKAFPEIVKYPSADNVEFHPRSYDDRRQFHSLEYRGELRKNILEYARARDLMHPEDCGTMTHWYSRTPPDFLEAVQPEFLPQWSADYGEKSGRVWDFRIRRNMENYFRLTEAHIRHYGSPEIFHTIGLAERGCFLDRRKNQKLKLHACECIEREVHSKYPNAPLLIASWDFVAWTNEEVRELIARLNPENTVLWDYISDTYDKVCNFTNWNVIGKFPYVFGIFHAFAASTEIRGNYGAMEQRFEKALEDPMCKGMIFWPENSHADPLMLEYFTANAWDGAHGNIREFIGEFCRRRYSRQRKAMKRIWDEMLPLIRCGCWRWNRQRDCEVYPDYAFTIAHAPKYLCDLTPESLERNRFLSGELKKHLRRAVDTLNHLAEIGWKKDEFLFRDTVDLARTAIGRATNYALGDLTLRLEAWRLGNVGKKFILKQLDAIGKLLSIEADILESHGDFSLHLSFRELEKSGPVNPEFENTLKGNAENFYCRSWVYELFRACYLPEFEAWRGWIAEKLESGDKTPWQKSDSLGAKLKEIEDRFYETPLQDLAPDTEKGVQNLSANLRLAAGCTARFMEG